LYVIARHGSVKQFHKTYIMKNCESMQVDKKKEIYVTSVEKQCSLITHGKRIFLKNKLNLVDIVSHYLQSLNLIKLVQFITDTVN